VGAKVVKNQEWFSIRGGVLFNFISDHKKRFLFCAFPHCTMAERFDEDQDNEERSSGRSKHKKKKKEHKKEKSKEKKKKDKKEQKKSKKRSSSHNAEDEGGERESAKRVKRGGREDSSSLCPPEDEIMAARRKHDEDEGGGATHDDGSGGGGVIKAPPRPLVESSALPQNGKNDNDDDPHNVKKEEPASASTITLLLFYQYVEPAWSDSFYQTALRQVKRLAEMGGLTGRCRIAKEGLNCTLSGDKDAVRTFCHQLRHWQPITFHTTEFKLTHDVPIAQRFRELKILPVTELVHYGLEGRKAPPLHSMNTNDTHLEPAAYHAKLAEPDTVVIDVRNHYEAAIGHFVPPPSSSSGTGGATYIDPKMRKSTEFPVWLDDPKTHETLRGKQVLMYCTGGIRWCVFFSCHDVVIILCCGERSSFCFSLGFVYTLFTTANALRHCCATRWSTIRTCEI
jgi:predicted sulfurtransferase